MPLAPIDPAKSKPVEATGRTVPVEMKTAVVQTRFEPMDSLITQISGSRMVVSWYRQMLGANDHPRPLTQGLPISQQQYEKINQLETRLQGDFSFSQNDSDKVQTVTGELILYPGVVPNDEDLFEADMRDGRRGLFKVIGNTRLSWMKKTCHRVQFQLLGPIDEMRPLFNNLQDKVVVTQHWITDFSRQGKNPLIIDDLYNDYRSLHRIQDTMISEYMRLFFSETCQTLLIPGQESICYDPFLVAAVLSLLETTQSPLLRKVSAHNTGAQYAFRTTTIWDAILQVEPSHLHLACQQLGLVSRGVIPVRAHFGGVYWSKIDRIMYPIEAREDADIDTQSISIQYPEGLKHGPAPIKDFQRLIQVKDLTGVETREEATPGDEVSNIHNVADDTYYVFSKAFYHQETENMSRLEKLVWSVLNQEELDVPTLAMLVKQSKEWDKLERFYYVPVLVALCTIALRGPAYV